MPAPSHGLLDACCPVEWGHPLNRGLVACWMVPPLSGWRGGLTLRDLVRGGRRPNDGTLTNGPTWGGSSRPGGYGSLSFDGVDDYVSVPVDPAYRVGATAVTFCCWAYIDLPTFAGAVKILLDSSATDPNGSGGGFFVAPDDRGGGGNATAGFKIELRVSVGIVYGFTVNSVLSGAAWYHVASWYDGVGGGGLYLNGKVQTANVFAAGSGAYIPRNAIFAIGAADNGALPLNGKVDDVRIYSRALPAVEARALYDASRKGYPDELRWVKGRAFSGPAGGTVARTPLRAGLSRVKLRVAGTRL